MQTSSPPDSIDRVRERSPLLHTYADRFQETTPFDGLLVGISAPLTPHTGLFVEVVASGGADVIVTGEAGSTHDDVVERLERHSRVTPLAQSGMSDVELETTRRRLLEQRPDLIADDGAHLLSLVHDEFPAVADRVIGACEQTTGGITRLQAMDAQNALSFPVYDVNGTPMKQHFDNVHGTAESSLTALTDLTNSMIAGSTAAVVGYGHCGRGIATKLRSLGARTVVTEIDPRKALEALADGHDVAPVEEAVRDAEFVLTSTGRYHVLREEHFEAMADGTVIATIGSAIEIDTDALSSLSVASTRPEPGVARYDLPDGRTLRLLTDGRVVNLAAPNGAGNPSEVMDTTFAMMARSLAALADGVDLDPGLHPVPDRLDREVATEKLEAMDVAIDEPTDEQRAYHAQWSHHATGETNE